MGASTQDALQIGDGLRVRSATLYTSSVMPDRIFMLKLDASAGGFTVTLPPAANVPGQLALLKKIDSTLNIITVSPNGAETIDGAAFQKLTKQYESLLLVSDGTTWLISGPIAAGVFDDLFVQQPADASGTPLAAVTVIAGAHTFVLNAEQNDIILNLARTVTFVGGGGTIGTERAMLIQAPTYSSSLSQAITTAATMAITGPPVAAGGMTITNTITFWAQSGNVQFGTVGTGLTWDGTNQRLGIGTSAPLAPIDSRGTGPFFAGIGEGGPMGPPTGIITATPSAGGLNGTYKYIYYEVDGDNDGFPAHNTSYSAETQVVAAANQYLVTVPQGRRGTFGRVLCRTKANGSTFFVLKDFGQGTEFHRTQFLDNVADGALTVAAPANVDTTRCWNYEINQNVKYIRSNPGSSSSAVADLTVLCGKGDDANSFAVHAYNTITAYTGLGNSFHSVHAGVAGTYGHLFCRFVTDVGDSSTYNDVFVLKPRGELLMTPFGWTSGTPLAVIGITGAAHTGLSNAEVTEINFNLSRTITFTGGGGAITNNRSILCQPPTLAAASAQTVTNAATLAISGSPAQGANVTVSNPSMLWLSGTDSYTAGTLRGLRMNQTYNDGGSNSTTVVYAQEYAPTINFTGASKTGKVNLIRLAPTLTSQPSGNNGGIIFSSAFTSSTFPPLRFHNVADEDTNYEDFQAGWGIVANSFVMRTTKGGSGTSRAITFALTGGTASLLSVNTASPYITAGSGLSSGSPITIVQVAPGSNSTSGNNIGISVAPNVNPTSTSTQNYYGIQVAPTINYSAGTPGAGYVYGLYIKPTNTALPTGLSAAIAIASSGNAINGIAWHNQVDEQTNYERVRAYFTGNIWTLASDIGGTGTLRGIQIGVTSNALGFMGATPVTRQNVTGSKGANAALTSLMTALATLGLVTDSTT